MTETTVDIDDDEAWERAGSAALANIDREMARLRRQYAETDRVLRLSNDRTQPIDERIALCHARLRELGK